MSASLSEVAAGSGTAFLLVGIAGSMSSLGPCTAARMIAVVSLVTDSPARGRSRVAAAFLLGLVLSYGAFGVFASLVGGIAIYSHWIYGLLAAAMLLAGLGMLYRNEGVHHCGTPGQPSLGRAFLMGASFTFVIAPCCTPILVAILAYCTQIHSVYYGVLLLVVFGIGHAVPVILAAGASQRASSRVQRSNGAPLLRVIGGTLMVALSGYYLCLA